MILSYLENSTLRSSDATNVKFDLFCDVLVIGVGAAGAYAAISASREGVSVIAIEREENIGGMPVNGLVGGYYYGGKGGTFENSDRISKEKRAIFISSSNGPDMRRIVLTEELNRHCVKLICGCAFDGVFFEKERACGITFAKDGIRQNIGAKMIIDATSDGHLIRMCPVKTEYGRPCDGKTVPFSIRAEIQKGEVCRYDNSDSGQGDPYHVREFSQKMIVARGAKANGLKNGKRLLSVSQVCGIREGIRYEGEDYLTYKDIIMQKKPRKILFYAYSDLDKHGHDLAIDDELYQTWWVISNLATVTANIPVPLGAIIPKGIKGLITAGRCMSIDSYASSAVRMNRDMFRMGECVGIAASMAVKESCDVIDINYNSYLEKVRRYDCFDGEKGKEFGFHFPGNNKPYTKISTDMTDEEILKQLKTDHPGPAIWSSYINGSDILAGKLRASLSSEDALFRYNCAIALGNMGRKEALPYLRELAKNRSDFFFKDCRRSNQFRSVVAICLIGRIGDISDIPMLEDIIFNDDEFLDPIYDLAPEYIHCNLSDARMILFQHFTHAVMSYIKISKRFGLECNTALSKRFTGTEREKVIRAITSAKDTDYIFSEISDFLDYAMKISK